MNLPQLPPDFAWAENIALGTPEVYRLSKISWPRFLLEESDIPDPILKFEITEQEFKEKFKVFGIRQISTGKLTAFIQAVHVQIDLAATELPDLGWRFSIQNASQRSPKNAMSLVEASIEPDFRGHGLSKPLLERVKVEAREQKMTQLIAPVRPTAKTKFPNESMQSYLNRNNENGKLFDPWLRTHIEAGAVITNVCHQSVCVKASLPKWREWTKMPLQSSGPVLIEGALMPVMIDTKAGLGVYTEPNVWVKYQL